MEQDLTISRVTSHSSSKSFVTPFSIKDILQDRQANSCDDKIEGFQHLANDHFNMQSGSLGSTSEEMALDMSAMGGGIDSRRSSGKRN